MKTFKNAMLAGLLLFGANSVCAETGNDELKITQLYVESRMGFCGEKNDGIKGATSFDNDLNTGFKGKFINVRIDGQIVPGLTFSYRQRLNKNNDATFFDATDWLHVDWKATDRLTLSAGKQVVAIGGYEYDRAPIDIYQYSEFCNNIGCYQLGASATYSLTPEDQLLVQVCNSPFRTISDKNPYAFNLMWMGGHGFWETMWSVNMLQRIYLEKTSGNKLARVNEWMNYIALGNKFNFSNNLWLELDLMNRAGSDHAFFMKDWSVMSELSYKTDNGMRVYGKFTHDENKSGSKADQLVQNGTSVNMVAAGVEYHPLKNHRDALRLYASGSYVWGKNGNPAGVNQDKQTNFEVGMKVKIAK